MGAPYINYIIDDPETRGRCIKMDEGFDEIYPTNVDYRRYHQRNTANGRAIRDRKDSDRDPSQKIARRAR